jgi:nucleoside-diphosphate-sugar epimerase
LFKVISQIMGKNIPPEFKPSNDNTLVNNRIGSTEKAKKDLGFEAKISLEEGLKQVINWKVNTLINSSKKPA